MLEVLTTYSEDAAKTQLTSSGFYLDKPGEFNNEIMNDGEKSRRSLFVANEWVQLSGKVISDITSQEKNLITGVSVGVRFVSTKIILPLTSVYEKLTT